MKSKILITIIAIVVSITVTGCASAQPNLVNGKYYMIGDSKCARYRVKNNSQIKCYTSSNKYVGYRNSMSNQEMSMYQHNQNMQQQSNQNAYNNNQVQGLRNDLYLQKLGY